MMSLTDEQRAIIEAPIKDTLCVVAYAGSGKTHTLLEYAKAHPHARTLYLAFNKAMADEAKRKFQTASHVMAKTIHSLAYARIGHQYREQLGNLRPTDVLPLAAGMAGQSDRLSLASLLLDALNEFMSSADADIHSFVAAYEESLESCLEHCHVPLPLFEKVLSQLWSDIVSKKMTVPHNAYLKLFQLSHELLPFDTILVDEAQDVTDAMIDIVMRQKGCKIFIGDPYQQIYAWNGAVNALDKLAVRGFPTLYLSQSFRCPPDVADKANAYLQILGAKVPFKGTQQDAGVTPHSKKAFLARSNASIFERAYQESQLGRKLHLLGGFDGYQFDTILDIAQLSVQKRPYDSFLQTFKNLEELETYTEETHDQQIKARLSIVKRHRHHVFSMYDKIKNANMPVNNSQIILSTVHKAKGQEYDDVELGGDFFNIKEHIADSQDGKDTAKGKIQPAVMVPKEELNLLYVAMTRSKHILRLPDSFDLTSQDVRHIKLLQQNQKLILTD